MRPLVGRKAGGVCLGIATYLNVDVTLIRVIAVLVFFFGGTGAMLYVICWFVMPSEEFVPPAAAPQTPPPAPAQPQGQ
jgi:phage shock protein PspC (stress-responsive transcriptional regulator)